MHDIDRILFGTGHIGFQIEDIETSLGQGPSHLGDDTRTIGSKYGHSHIGDLVLVQMAGERSSREEVREGVLEVKGFPGVTGVLTIRPDGNARKRPFLLAVERGRIAPAE